MNEWRQEVLKRNRTGNNYYLRRITKEIEQNRIRIPELENHEVVVIDFEDEFSDMLVDMMRRMGADVRKESWEDIDLKNPPDPSIMILGG